MRYDTRKQRRYMLWGGHPLERVREVCKNKQSVINHVDFNFSKKEKDEMDRKYLMSLQDSIEKELRKIEEKHIRVLFEDAKNLVSAAYLLELGNDFRKNFLKIVSIGAVLESKFYTPESEIRNIERYNMLLIDETIGLADSYVDDEEIIIRRKKNGKTNW
jgi:hypothetical protein